MQLLQACVQGSGTVVRQQRRGAGVLGMVSSFLDAASSRQSTEGREEHTALSQIEHNEKFHTSSIPLNFLLLNTANITAAHLAQVLSHWVVKCGSLAKNHSEKCCEAPSQFREWN